MVYNPEQTIPSERFITYRRGFRDGVMHRTKQQINRPDLEAEYELGYNDGRVAYTLALNKCAERVGYDQIAGILRSVKD